MKGLNLQQFKKVHEDEHSATLMHPKGHKITIAKKALASPLKKQLAELPMQHFSDGTVDGPVEEPNSSSIYDTQDQSAPVSSQPDPSLAQEIGSGVRNVLGYASDVGPVGMFKAAKSIAGSDAVKDFKNGLMGEAQAAEPQVSQQPSATNIDLGHMIQPQQQMKDPNAGLVSGLQGDVNQYKQGQQEEAQAIGEQGQQEADAAQKQMDTMQAIQSDADSKWKELQGHYEAALNDVKNGHIDPNHYMENKSALGKVSTAIGLILGGIGGGLLHQENPALKFLNSQIDRDIESQKAEMGKKDTVLSAYYHQFGNIRDATQMARATQMGIYSAQLEKAAATAKDPIAQARAKQAAAQYDFQARQLMAPLALKASVMQGAGAGKVDPSLSVRLFVDPKDREAAYKELQMAQNHAKQSQAIMSAFDQANGTNTVGNRALHLGYEPASVATLQTSLMPYLKDAEGRINEQELERTDALIPRPGDGPDKIAMKRQALQQFLEEKSSTPILDSYGIRVPRMGGAKPLQAPANYRRS